MTSANGSGNKDIGAFFIWLRKKDKALAARIYAEYKRNPTPFLAELLEELTMRRVVDEIMIEKDGYETFQMLLANQAKGSDGENEPK